MRFLPAGRLAALTLLAAPASQALADNFFHGLCKKGECVETQRIVLPRSQVDIVQEQPRVSVREIRPVRVRSEAGLSVAASPVIGTVFMPMQMPMMQMVQAAPATIATTTTTQASAFDGFSATMVSAIQASLQHDMAKAQLQLTIDAQKRLLELLNKDKCKDGDNKDNKDQNQDAIVKKLDDINSRLSQMDGRLGNLEKLTSIHQRAFESLDQFKPPVVPPKKKEDETQKNESKDKTESKTQPNTSQSQVLGMPTPMTIPTVMPPARQ